MTSAGAPGSWCSRAVTTEPPPPPPPTTTSAVVVQPTATVQPIIGPVATTSIAPPTASPTPTAVPVPAPQPTSWHVPLWLYLLLGAGLLAAIRRVLHRARPPAAPSSDIDVVGHLDSDPHIRVSGDDGTALSVRVDAHAGPTAMTLHREQP
ncbi:MAG TPA: hypothetical protein VIW24_11355 [Aldersonia sp.]